MHLWALGPPAGLRPGSEHSGRAVGFPPVGRHRAVLLSATGQNPLAIDTRPAWWWQGSMARSWGAVPRGFWVSWRFLGGSVPWSGAWMGRGRVCGRSVRPPV